MKLRDTIVQAAILAHWLPTFDAIKENWNTAQIQLVSRLESNITRQEERLKNQCNNLKSYSINAIAQSVYIL